MNEPKKFLKKMFLGVVKILTKKYATAQRFIVLQHQVKMQGQQVNQTLDKYEQNCVNKCMIKKKLLNKKSTI